MCLKHLQLESTSKSADPRQDNQLFLYCNSTQILLLLVISTTKAKWDYCFFVCFFGYFVLFFVLGVGVGDCTHIMIQIFLKILSLLHFARLYPHKNHKKDIFISYEEIEIRDRQGNLPKNITSLEGAFVLCSGDMIFYQF